MENVLNIRRDWANLGDQMRALLAGAQSAGRDLTAEEQEKFDRMAEDADQMEEKIARLEKHELRQRRINKAPGRDRHDDTHQAYDTFVRSGGVSSRGLESADDAKGGFLVPEEIEQEILKGETEFCPFRSIARVSRTSSDALKVPKRNGQFAAVWASEMATRSETDGLRYGMEEIATEELIAVVDVSMRNLEDAAFDMEAEIDMEAAEQFAVAESLAFVAGNGVKKPWGVIHDTAISDTNSGANGDFDADDLIDLLYGLKGAYLSNATWLFNRSTLRKIRKMKANNEYIWAPAGTAQSANSIVGGIAGTILDRPYMIAPEMQNTGTTGNISVAVGDFRRGYRIVDRLGIAVTRDPYTQQASGMVRFWFRKRVGGQVVMGEAIRRLKESA